MRPLGLSFGSGDYESAVPLIEQSREIIQSLDDARPGKPTGS